MNRMLLFLMFCFATCAQASFYDRKAEGWHFFEEAQQAVKPVELEPIPTPPEVQRAPTPTEQIEAMRKALEEKLHLAVINPTNENVRSYMVEQRKTMDSSERFAKVWQRNLFSHPDLDETVATPVDHRARRIHLRQQAQSIDRKIASLSQEYGLFFFFKQDCAFCHNFAETVKAFSDKYKWDVLAVSLHGGRLPEFPNAQPNNGIIQKLGVKNFPTLIAVHGKTGKTLPLATGMISMDEIIRRLHLLTEKGGFNAH